MHHLVLSCAKDVMPNKSAVAVHYLYENRESRQWSHVAGAVLQLQKPQQVRWFPYQLPHAADLSSAALALT